MGRKEHKKGSENINKKVNKCLKYKAVKERKVDKQFLSPCYFCSVRFIESVYSEKFHLVHKKLSALWSVPFMVFRFIETFL